MPKDTTKEPKGQMLASAVVTATRRASGSAMTLSATSTIMTEVSSCALSTDKAEKFNAASSSEPQTAVVTKAILDSLEVDTMHESWRKALAPEFKKPYFTKLKTFLLAEHTSHTVYPTIDNVYSWSRFTPLNEVKVVILGQDPYHDVGQAHGLSFSVLAPTKPPPSLKNIYKQLASDIPGFSIPISGDLSAVAKQGVLWLNASLTVRAHKAGSHARKGWETFTSEAIRAVLQRNGSQPGVVFMAWGLHAEKTCDKIRIDQKKHLVLRSAHPSPLSAHRGFLGNGHFRQANEWLAKNYGKDAQIDWTVLNTK